MVEPREPGVGLALSSLTSIPLSIELLGLTEHQRFLTSLMTFQRLLFFVF